MKEKKKLTIPIILIWLIIIESVLVYYGNFFLQRGGYFSEGFLVGWIFGVVFSLAIVIIGLSLKLIYNNFKVRWTENIR